MKKYDFEKMVSIWKDESRTIMEKWCFISNSGNFDLLEYSGTVYSIKIIGSGCSASALYSVADLRRHLYRLRHISGYSALIPHYWESINYDFLVDIRIA